MLSDGARALKPGLAGSSLVRAGRLFCPSAAARVWAYWRRSALDRELAAGRNPAGSSALAARAAILSARPTRVRIASGLERMAVAADHPPSRFGVLPSRAAVRANRAELLELAWLLRHDRPLYAGGIALLRLVVVDGTGPAYTDRHGEALTAQLRLARKRLSV